jgi:hypothetical protein
MCHPIPASPSIFVARPVKQREPRSTTKIMSEADGSAQRTQALAEEFRGKELMDPSGIA